MQNISMDNIDYEHSFNAISHILCIMNANPIDMGLTTACGFVKIPGGSIWVEIENG